MRGEGRIGQGPGDERSEAGPPRRQPFVLELAVRLEDGVRVDRHLGDDVLDRRELVAFVEEAEAKGLANLLDELPVGRDAGSRIDVELDHPEKHFTRYIDEWWLGAARPSSGARIGAISRSVVVTAPDTESFAPHLRRRQLVGLAVALALVPLVISAVALVVKVGDTYYPGSDLALTELRTRDVGRHPVLLGLPSRDRWNHPGPALFYLLAGPYRLSGSASIGLDLGALLINGLAIAGMAFVARRHGGTPLLLLTLLGSGLLVRSLGPDLLRNPWNPYITVLPFGLLVFLTWAMTCGDAWALPVSAGVASFCAQTHVGYVPLAVPLFAWGAAGLTVAAFRRGAGGRRALTRAALVATAVLFVLWLPPIVEQLSQSPGNMSEIVKYFTASNNKAHTLADGYRVIAAQFAWLPEWVTGHQKLGALSAEPTYLYSERVPVLFVPLVVAAVVVWARRMSGARRLTATLAVALLSGVFAVERTVGLVYEYRLRWTWVLGMIAGLVVAWTAWTVVRRRWLVPASLAALVVLAGVNSASAVTARPPYERESSALRALTPQVVEALPPGDGDVLVRPESFGSYFVATGLVLQLERRGIAGRVDPGREDAFGEHRVHRRGPLRSILTVAADIDVERLSARSGLRVIAYRGKRPRRERSELSALVAQLDARHGAGLLDDLTWVRERSKLEARLGPAVAVFAPRTAP